MNWPHVGQDCLCMLYTAIVERDLYFIKVLHADVEVRVAMQMARMPD